MIDEIDLAFFRQDKELIDFVKKVSGYDWTDMSKIDDKLMIVIAGMVEKYGFDEAVKKASQIDDRTSFSLGSGRAHSMKAFMRKAAMDNKFKRLGD